MKALRWGGLSLAVFALPVAGGSSDPVVHPPPSLPAEVDLRPRFEQWGLARTGQGARPTCSVFTVVGALEYAFASCSGPGPRLSVEFLNWAANQVAGDASDGALFASLFRGFARYGVCLAEVLPYRAAFDPAAAPPPEAIADAAGRLDRGLRVHWIKEWDPTTGASEAHLLAIRRALHAGWPVCGGFRWPSREQWIDGVLQMCPEEAVYDGHSILLVGYRDEAAQPGGGRFIFRNTSGNGLDGCMPSAYLRSYLNDAAWVDCARPANEARLCESPPTATLP